MAISELKKAKLNVFVVEKKESQRQFPKPPHRTMTFSSTLIRWYEENGRKLPWRGIRDPYRIWLSEIILQQTRIEQGMAYYRHFTERYPTVRDLAEADEEQVLKSWQGLGYYSRARNLHAAARQIMERHGGIFPSRYEEILALKGVGRYTAAAIASFAFRLPYPVIDGNVYRFIARLYDIATPIATPAAYNEFESLLKKLIDPERPNIFNQALMDFGALVCKPVGYACGECPFAKKCLAHQRGKERLLPVKQKSAEVKHRHFYYFDIEWETGRGRSHLLHQRTDKDIWKGLYEFPLYESDSELSAEALKQTADELIGRLSDAAPLRIEKVGTAVHKLTHRHIHATFLHVILPKRTQIKSGKEQEFDEEEMKKLPVSRLIDKYLLRV